MLKDRNIIDAPEASLYGQPQVQFRPNDFDAAIWFYGYDVVCEWLSCKWMIDGC